MVGFNLNNFIIDVICHNGVVLTLVAHNSQRQNAKDRCLIIQLANVKSTDAESEARWGIKVNFADFVNTSSYQHPLTPSKTNISFMWTAPIYFLLLLSSLISKVDDYQLVASVCLVSRLYWSCIKVWDVYCKQGYILVSDGFIT